MKIEGKALIIFLDDDGQRKKDEVIVKEKTVSYVSFEYHKKIITIPWSRVLKLKEDEHGGN